MKNSSQPAPFSAKWSFGQTVDITIKDGRVIHKTLVYNNDKTIGEVSIFKDKLEESRDSSKKSPSTLVLD